MAKLLKLRRGTTSQHNTFTGAEGEVTIDTTKDTAVVHDGSTAGGTPLAKEDMSNVSSASIAGRLGADSIATTKIAAGALPTDVTVATANLGTTGVTAGAYGSSSAIPIVTVNNKGQVTAASTTAIDSTKIQNGTTEVATASGGDITMKRSGTTRLVVDNEGVDVTGKLTTTDNVTITSTAPKIFLVDSDTNDDFSINGDGGTFRIKSETDSANRFVVNSDGHVDIPGNLDCGAGVDVTGNITVSGTVDGVDVAALKTSKDSLSTTNGVLLSSVTVPTQPQSNDSTKIATTAYVRTAITEAKPFPTGTLMLFAQTSAPTGWTKSTTHNNKALRVVSGTAGSGGSNAFSNTLADRGITANAANATQGGNVSVTVANTTQTGNVSVDSTTQTGNVSISSVSTSGSVNSHTLSVNEMPSHSHGATFVAARNQARYSGGPGISGVAYVNFQNNARQNQGSANAIVNNTGGNGGHSHGFSGGSHSHNANASFSGSAHNHNISVTT